MGGGPVRGEKRRREEKGRREKERELLFAVAQASKPSERIQALASFSACEPPNDRAAIS
jgi:hypothetical protein